MGGVDWWVSIDRWLHEDNSDAIRLFSLWSYSKQEHRFSHQFVQHQHSDWAIVTTTYALPAPEHSQRFGCIYLRQATELSFSFLRSLFAEPGAWVGNVLLPKTQMCIWSRKVWIRYLDCLMWKWKSFGRCKGGVLVAGKADALASPHPHIYA
jgi:hypothetical protein